MPTHRPDSKISTADRLLSPSCYIRFGSASRLRLLSIASAALKGEVGHFRSSEAAFKAGTRLTIRAGRQVPRPRQKSRSRDREGCSRRADALPGVLPALIIH